MSNPQPPRVDHPEESNDRTPNSKDNPQLNTAAVTPDKREALKAVGKQYADAKVIPTPGIPPANDPTFAGLLAAPEKSFEARWAGMGGLSQQQFQARWDGDNVGGKHPDPASCYPDAALKKLLTTASKNMEDPQSLGNVHALVSQYKCDATTQHDAINVVKLILHSKDRFDAVITPADNQAYFAHLRGDIGVSMGVMTVKDGETTTTAPVIENVISGSPAERAGLKNNDIILAIDGHPTLGMPPPKVAESLKGENNTPVELTIQRGDQLQRLTVTREPTQPGVDPPRDGEDGIRYIRIRSWNETAFKDLQEAMSRPAAVTQGSMSSHEEPKAFVIDLRGNTGGRLDQGLLAAGLFMPAGGTIMRSEERQEAASTTPQYGHYRYQVDSAHGGVVKVDERSGSSEPVTDTDGQRTAVPYLLNGRPVIVLTDPKTASTSEVFLAALHQGINAPLVGEHTFGKGIVQTQFPMQDLGVALQVTSGKLFTPDGKHWAGDGQKQTHPYQPDVPEQPLSPSVEIGSAGDVPLRDALALARQSLKPHR